MKDIKSIVLGLCGYKIVWNDCIVAGVRLIRILKGFHLTEHEEMAIRKWAKSESKKVLFVNTMNIEKPGI